MNEKFKDKICELWIAYVFFVKKYGLEFITIELGSLS